MAIYFLSHNKTLFGSICFLGIVGFLLTLSIYTDTKRKRDYCKNKLKIIDKELRFLELRVLDFEAGDEFTDANHYFANDIDLYGDTSLFQHLNRTVIKEAKDKLAFILGENSIIGIQQKQESIKDLASDPDWRLNYTTKSTIIDQKISHNAIFNWLASYQPIINQVAYYLTFLVGLMSFLSLTLYLFDIWTYVPLLVIFFFGLLVSSFYIKRINKISIHLSELKNTFSNYGDLIKHIEKKEFKSEICKSQQSLIRTKGMAASQTLLKFSRYLSALDQRNNILFAVFGNGFFLWDCNQVYKIEKWINVHRNDVEDWFSAIVWFDAHNSLANHAFNNPEFIYPEISANAGEIIKARGLGHFMLDPEKRVDNNFEISNASFTIITGANMAGKSTFLRTISSTIVFANLGLPVCAEKMVYRPIKLITSMRNTDSLQDDSSYFFSELTRLKMIVDAIREEPYFIILDEILKGTNSKDKEEGSIRLMERLSKTNSSGLIATHDLGLCSIAERVPNINNQYFDAQIIDNELIFDYHLKKGICQNMNASFLLKKMRIV